MVTSRGARARAVRTRICSFRLDGRGFVEARLDEGSSMDLADAREAVDATWKVAGECRRPVLVNNGGEPIAEVFA